MKKTNKGFTLVELIIVIAVIGVLAAILIPTFANVIDKANRKSAFSDAKNALQIFLAEKTTGVNGGVVVGDGSTFKVEKANKDWYFVYVGNGLTEAGEGEAIHTATAAVTANSEVVTSATTIENWPATVTLYLIGA